MIINKDRFEIERAKMQLSISEIGVSKTTLTRINRGLNLNPLTVGKIANALGCEVEDLIVLGGEEDAEAQNA